MRPRYRDGQRPCVVGPSSSKVADRLCRGKTQWDRRQDLIQTPTTRPRGFFGRYPRGFWSAKIDLLDSWFLKILPAQTHREAGRWISRSRCQRKYSFLGDIWDLPTRLGLRLGCGLKLRSAWRVKRFPSTRIFAAHMNDWFQVDLDGWRLDDAF